MSVRKFSDIHESFEARLSLFFSSLKHCVSLSLHFTFRMLSLLSADIPGIGRVDKAMFSDQQLMESFFTPDSFEDARKALGGSEDDACTWNEVLCEDERVTNIDWHEVHIALSGSINFSMLPIELIELSLYKQSLYGEMDTSDLPRAMQMFCVQICAFTGTISLVSLPPALMRFIVTDNQISALTNFEYIPQNLGMLRICEDAVDMKTLKVGKLPQTYLNVSFAGCRIEEVTYEDAADAWRVQLRERRRKTKPKYGKR